MVFVRRVPTEFAAFDTRGIVKHSTKIRIADDRNGRRASRLADKLNQELAAHWRALVGKDVDDQANRYELARQHVRELGFDFLDMPQLIALPPERTVERAEALVAKGLQNDPVACAGILERFAVPNSRCLMRATASRKGTRPDFFALLRVSAEKQFDRMSRRS